jgi:hypothetical protein
MGYIILIVIGYVCVSWLAGVMRHFMKSETVALWIVAFILMLIPHWGWLGFVVLVWRYIIIPIGRYQERQERNGNKSSISNTTVMWLVPLFWPFLILKSLLGDKPVKTDTTYSDYLEHKRHNAK